MVRRRAQRHGHPARPPKTHPTRYPRATRGQIPEVRTLAIAIWRAGAHLHRDVSDYVKVQADRQRLNELLAATQNDCTAWADGSATMCRAAFLDRWRVPTSTLKPMHSQAPSCL